MNGIELKKFILGFANVCIIRRSFLVVMYMINLSGPDHRVLTRYRGNVAASRLCIPLFLSIFEDGI